MSNLNTLINGFDALSGAAFGGGGGGGGGGSARSPINSHPSAMTSAQYNYTYTPDNVPNCTSQGQVAVILGSLTAGKTVGYKLGAAVIGTVVNAAVCAMYK